MRFTDTENRLMVAKWQGLSGAGRKGEEVKNYQLAVTGVYRTAQGTVTDTAGTPRAPGGHRPGDTENGGRGGHFVSVLHT